MAARTDVFCLCLVMLVTMVSKSSAKSVVGDRVHLSRTSGLSLLGEKVFLCTPTQRIKITKENFVVYAASPLCRHRILSRAKYTKRLTRAIKHERNKADSPEHQGVICKERHFADFVYK